MPESDSEPDAVQPASWRQQLARFEHGFRAPFADEINAVAAVVFAATSQTGDDAETGTGGVEIEDIYLAAAAIPGLRDRLADCERQLLEAARDRGESWAALAQRLGRGTEQAMQQHYRRLGGERNWPRSPRVAQAREALREAIEAADRPYTSSADRILVVTGLRRAMNKALEAGAMTAESMQAAVSCSHYTFALARDVDYNADDALPDPSDETYLPLLLAIEMMLEDQWWAMPPNPGTLAIRTRHPAAPTPVRAWNQLASDVQEDYLAQARVQLDQPPAPNWHPWLIEWRTWHRLFSLGTVVAHSEDSWRWELYDPADTALDNLVFSASDHNLLDLMEAGLVVVDRAGQPVARPQPTTRRERLRGYIPVS